MFCATNWGQSIEPVTNTLQISGKIPSTVKDASYAFMYINVRVPYDILSTATALTNGSALFTNSTITFYIPTGSTALLPSYTYIDPDTEEEITVTLTDAVDKNFFSTALTNINFMFQGSNVQIIDSQVFSTLANLETCISCFRGSHGGKFDQDVYIDTLWRQCPKLTSVAGCFENIINVSCNSTLLFNNAITSSKTIDISGLFGISSFNVNSLPIAISISSIVPNLITDDYHSAASNTTRYNGVFQNRSVYLTDSTSSVLSKINGVCRKMFYNTVLYLDDNVTTIDTSNVTNSESMFTGCATFSADTTARKFIEVSLPTSCATHYAMFYRSKMLSDLPPLRSASL